MEDGGTVVAGLDGGPAAATVDEADQPETEAGHGDPQPPLLAVALQVVAEYQQDHECDRPGDDPDDHGGDAGQVQRLHVSVHELATGRTTRLGARSQMA